MIQRRRRRSFKKFRFASRSKYDYIKINIANTFPDLHRNFLEPQEIIQLKQDLNQDYEFTLIDGPEFYKNGCWYFPIDIYKLRTISYNIEDLDPNLIEIIISKHRSSPRAIQI